MDTILQAARPDDERILRAKTVPFDFSSYSACDIDELVTRMKRTMHAAHGIGIAANQIGLPYRVFVGQLPNAQGKPKFYALFNPELEKAEGDRVPFEEGCLSVPGTYGPVARPERIVLRAFDKHARPVRIKAWGLLARMFQHELDHLDGKLFIDTATTLYTADGGTRHE